MSRIDSIYILDFIYIESCSKIGKRKEGYSSNQTMTFSFSFATLARIRATLLHHKGILAIIIIIKSKLSLIKVISSRIQATSSEQILSEFKRSTSSAKLHSTSTFEKQCLDRIASCPHHISHIIRFSG